MEVTQHARYTCTFCGKVRNTSSCEDIHALECGSEHSPSDFRTLSSEQQLGSGIAAHAAKQLQEEHGLSLRLLQRLSAGKSLVFQVQMETVFLMPLFSTIRRLREITEA